MVGSTINHKVGKPRKGTWPSYRRHLDETRLKRTLRRLFEADMLFGYFLIIMVGIAALCLLGVIKVAITGGGFGV